MNKYRILIAGGDMRQIYCANRLSQEFETGLTGFDRDSIPYDIGLPIADIGSPVRYDCAVLPVPPIDDAGNIYTPCSSGTLTFHALHELLTENAVIFAGKVTDRLKSALPATTQEQTTEPATAAKKQIFFRMGEDENTEPFLTSDHITNCSMEIVPNESGQSDYVVDIFFDDEGKDIFAKATAEAAANGGILSTEFSTFSTSVNCAPMFKHVIQQPVELEQSFTLRLHAQSSKTTVYRQILSDRAATISLSSSHIKI